MWDDFDACYVYPRIPERQLARHRVLIWGTGTFPISSSPVTGKLALSCRRRTTAMNVTNEWQSVSVWSLMLEPKEEFNPAIVRDTVSLEGCRMSSVNSSHVRDEEKSMVVMILIRGQRQSVDWTRARSKTANSHDSIRATPLCCHKRMWEELTHQAGVGIRGRHTIYCIPPERVTIS